MDSNDFSKFYRENLGKIYRFILLKVSDVDVAQDLTSETFLRTWKYLTTRKDPVKNVRALAYKISRNLIIDWYRKRPETVVPLEDPAVELALQSAKPGISPEYALALKSEIEDVRKALAKLRPEHGEAVILHYLNDLTIPEISEIFGESEGTIRVWVHRGLTELREKLSENDGMGQRV